MRVKAKCSFAHQTPDLHVNCDLYIPATPADELLMIRDEYDDEVPTKSASPPAPKKVSALSAAELKPDVTAAGTD